MDIQTEGLTTDTHFLPGREERGVPWGVEGGGGGSVSAMGRGSGSGVCL